MKTVKYLVNLVIIPLGVLLFMSAGIISAFISAGIEYSVLKQFFSSVGEESTSSVGIAILLVIAFEFTKIFLHFYQKRVQQHRTVINENNGTALKGVKLLIVALVVFSFICSVIFTVSTLYLSAYDEETVKAEIDAINSNLKDEIQAVENKYAEEYEKRLEPFKIHVEELRSGNTNVPEGVSGPKTMTAYMEGQDNILDTAFAQLQTVEESIAKEMDNKIKAETERLNLDAQSKIRALTDTSSPEVAARYDNPIIAAFLTVLANALFGGKTYSRSAYLWVSVALGLIVAALLEAIISFSMQFLSTPLDFLTDNMDNINAKIKAWCATMVITIFKAFGAVIIYTVILFFLSLSLQREKIWLGLLACTLSIWMTRKYIPMSSAEGIREQIIYGIRDCILQGVVSLMSFVLLGFVFGNDVLRLDINAVAVGIGATLSGGIIQLPNFLIKATGATTN